MTTDTNALRGATTARPAAHVLRLGIVLDGNIIEERLLRRAGKVTVGSSPRNSIAIPGAALPVRTVLFEIDRKGRPALRLDAVEQGRIAVGGRIESLERLRGTGRRVLPLDRHSRGKLQLGELTLLFQLVQAPPVAPRAKLPPSVRGGVVAELNWVMAASFICVALVQAAFVVYLRTLDPPNHDLQPSLPEFISAGAWLEIPKAKPLNPAKLTKVGEAALNKAYRRPAPSRGQTNKPSGHARAKPCGAACKQRRRASIKRQIMRAGVIALLAHRGKGPGSTVSNLIGNGKPSASTDKAFAKIGGLTVASRGAALTTRDGPRGPNEAVKIDTLAGRVSGPERVNTGGDGPKERVPLAEVKPDRKRITCVLPVDEVARTIRRGMPAVRTCYQRALKRDRGLGGKMVLRLSVNTMGQVTGVGFDTDTISDPLVNRCIRGYARRWRFPQSRAGGSDITVPLLLRPATR